MKRTISLLIIALLAGFITLAGCSKKPTNKGSETTKAKWTIGMSQCNLGEPWRVQMNADVKAAADKHPEIKVVFKDAERHPQTTLANGRIHQRWR